MICQDIDPNHYDMEPKIVAILVVDAAAALVRVVTAVVKEV